MKLPRIPQTPARIAGALLVAAGIALSIAYTPFSAVALCEVRDEVASPGRA